MLEELMGAPVPYASARADIAPGDILLLHHEFTAPWYGLSWYDFQVKCVQDWTGPFAHIALLDRITVAGRERVVVYESVVPKVRSVPVSATAERGFFWISMRTPMSPKEAESFWNEENGRGEYDKEGAILAGADKLPADEDANPRRWCAKLVALSARKRDVDLAPPRHARDPGRYVPTDMYFEAVNRFNGVPRFVSM